MLNCIQNYNFWFSERSLGKISINHRILLLLYLISTAEFHENKKNGFFTLETLKS